MIAVTKSVEKTVYVAQDGREFDKEKDCVRYDSNLEFDGLSEENGQIVRYIYDDDIKGLTEIYLDMKNTNNLSVCTELYIAKVNNDLDARQVSAFCRSKEGNNLRHWSNEFKDGEIYLICVHTTFTKMFGDDNMVFIIPYTRFREFWSDMLKKINNLQNYNCSVNDTKPVVNIYKAFNNLIKETSK